MRIDRQDQTLGCRAPVRDVEEHDGAFAHSRLPLVRTIARRSTP